MEIRQVKERAASAVVKVVPSEHRRSRHAASWAIVEHSPPAEWALDTSPAVCSLKLVRCWPELVHAAFEAMGAPGLMRRLQRADVMQAGEAEASEVQPQDWQQREMMMEGR